MAVATRARSVRWTIAIRRLGWFVLNDAIRHPANILTGFRLLAVAPIVLLVLDDRHVAAFILFLAAALSDALDGAVAKWVGRSTRFGAMLDPIADKLLIWSTFMVLADGRLVPHWLVAGVIGRDGVVLGGFAVTQFLGVRVRVQPLVVGKLATFSQLLLLGFVLGHLAGVADVALWISILVPVVAILTFVSALACLWAVTRGDRIERSLG